MWMYALALPLAGVVGDRVPRKTLILGGLLFWSVITMATSLAQEYWHLVVFRALEGFGEAFYFPASMALISAYHGPETRSRAMALHQSSVYVGTVAGGWLSGLLAEYFGWYAGFYVFGYLGIVLGVGLFWLLKEPPPRQADIPSPAVNTPADIWDTVQEIFTTGPVLVLMAVFIGANFVASIFLTWMPSFLHEKFDMGLSMAGFSATAYLQVASVLGVLNGGVLADRLARRHRGGRMLTQAIGLSLGVPFLFLTGWTREVPVLVLAMIGFGYFKGLYDANIWASLYDVVKPERRASALGFMNSIGWIGGAVAPDAIAAASEDYGMSACLSATSLIYLVLGLALVYASWTQMRLRKDRYQE
jgi:MFS family permease